MKNVFKSILIATFLIFGYINTPKLQASSEGTMAVVQGVTPISISKAKELIADGAYLFDANEEEIRNEYGYIEGSVHINTDNWQSLLPKDKNATIVLHCLNRLCYISSEMAVEIQKMGYKNVYVMIEGIEAWIMNGNPVVKKDITDKNKYVGSNNWSKSTAVTDTTDIIHRQMNFGEIPSCRDCHGVNVGGGQKSIIADVASVRSNINKNCSSCHQDVAHEYQKSIHGQSMKSDTPMCSECHTIHAGKEITAINMKKESDRLCGECHQKEKELYHTTFHGKAMYLENPGKAISVAACFDCHGKHNINKPDNANSTIHPGKNRIETCASCHPGAGETFSNISMHPNPHDSENFPTLNKGLIFMEGLLIFVFVFFMIHTTLWFYRLMATKAKYPKEWKEAKEKAHSDPIKIKRFTKFHKIQHLFLAASFLGLGFSGLPQKYYTADWAQGMIDLMGGPIGATQFHHTSAIIMIIVFLSHIVEVMVVAYGNRKSVYVDGKFSWKIFWRNLFGPDSLMPNLQDFRDLAENFKWFIGKRATMPQFDRWTYWEKFDYLAVFWGMFIIGLSGLVLWFPVGASGILPAWLIDLATIFHSEEALLALGFIFMFHFFHTHFRANKFPMDMVIFSGQLTEEEMKQERGPWYKRLKESGKFDQFIVKNDEFTPAKKKFWFMIGYAIVITGLVFLALIINAYF